jgi:F420-non-reducing hydrogenase large subunit
VVTKANLIVGTTNNYAPIQMSTTKAAQHLIKGGKVNEGLLNMVEMAFRAYDPCFGCATHSLPGQMPLEVTIHNANGEVVDVLKQFVY